MGGMYFFYQVVLCGKGEINEVRGVEFSRWDVGGEV